MIQNHMVRTLSLSPEEMLEDDGVLTPVPYTPERLERAKEAIAGLELCDELSARYGLDVGTPLRTNTTQPGAIPGGLAERIAEDNALDMELYDYACHLYEARAAQAPLSEQLDVAQGQRPVIDAPAGVPGL